MKDKSIEMGELSSFKRRLNSRVVKQIHFLHRFYGVELIYDEKTTISYLLEVHYTGWLKNDYESYTINRKRVFKNEIQINSIIEELAEKCSECIYPLKLKINTTEKVIGVSNQTEIKKRWEALLPRLKKEYTGKGLEGYINQITENINDEERLYKSLMKDPIYSLLFSNIYGDYGKEGVQTIQKKIALEPETEGLVYEGKQMVAEEYDKYNRLNIFFEGQLVSKEILKEGALKMRYQLESDKNSIVRIDGKASYGDGKNHHKKVQFKIIWQKDLEKTEEQRIAYEKRAGIYQDPNKKPFKWYQFWRI